MAHLSRRKHAVDRQPRLTGSAALTALAIALPATALAEDQVLPTVDVSAATASVPYKADKAISDKYTAPLLDTPKTVSVITKEVLKETNATTLKEALRTTSGITFGMGEGGNPEGDRPFIRGFDSQANTFIDGLRDPGSQSRDMFAVEAINVVKGADSAFSGGGAVGGSINLATKQAKLDNFGEADLTLGTDEYQRAAIDINRQLGETSAVRLNVMGHKGDVPGRDHVDYRNWGAAAALAFGLGTPTRATIDYYHYQTSGMPDYGIPYNNPISKYATVAAGTGGSTATKPPTVAPTLNPNAALNGDGGPLGVNRSNFYGLTARDFRDTQVDSGTIKLEHDLNERFTVSNATRFTRSSNDYVATNPGDSSANIVNGSATLPRSVKSRNSTSDAFVNATDLHGSFETGTIKHTIATGIEFGRNEVDTRAYTVTGASNANIQNPNPNDPWTGTVVRATQGAKLTTDTVGLYAFDTLTLSPQWLLNLGLRYDKFDTQQRGYSTDGSAPTTVNLDSSAHFWSYQAGIVFKPAENGSIYLNYATAANPSGLSTGDGADGLSVTNKDLEPEEVRSIELGTKWNVLDNKLALTAALFNIEKTNAKINLDANTLTTAGKQVINGFELGAAGAITSKWNVTASYTFMDSELKDAGPSYWSVRNGVWSYNESASGKRFPNTPRDSFSLWSTYELLPKLKIGGGAYYVGKQYGNTTNTKWIPAYWRFDGMASYDVNKSLSLRLNVQNLFDKVYYDRAYVTHMVSVAPARQVTLNANIKF